MVIGSAATGTATDRSDVDVLVVSPAGGQRPPFERTMSGVRLVEIMAKTYEDWLAHLDSPWPRWVYSFLDGGAVLFDDGSVASLRAKSEAVLGSYRAPAAVRAELATILWHSQAKLERAALSEDLRSASYWAGMVVPALLDGLFALHDRPCVPGSRRMDVLASLSLDSTDQALIDGALVGPPGERLAAVRALASSLLERLGPPDLLRLEW